MVVGWEPLRPSASSAVETRGFQLTGRQADGGFRSADWARCLLELADYLWRPSLTASDFQPI
jgi:hypothetical protein